MARPVTQRVLVFVATEAAAFRPEDPVLPFECVAVETEDPVPAIHVGAGCMFAPGRIAEELPYDPRLYFHGEEQAFALRAWTRGWDLWQIPGMPLYHLYTQPGSAPRPMHWSPEHDSQRAVRWNELEGAARHRLAALLYERRDLGVFGLGSARSLDDYAAFSGIDYSRRVIEPRARKARFGYS
jgi:GT2 family glycosyltransferase